MEIQVGGGSGSQKSYDKPWTVVMKRGEESPGKEESSPSIIGGLGTATSSGVKTVIKEGKSGFTPAQLQELEVQSLIQKHLAAGLPVPYHLVLPIWKSVATTFGTSQGGSIYKQYPSFIGFSTQGFDYRNMVDPEPGRCRRTDGKKWRCSRSIVPDQKYCAQHMHRGRQRSRKPVEASEASPSSANNLKRQLENSASNLSNSVGLQLMTKSSNSTNVSHSNITTTSSYYGSKKRVSCITAPSITTSISSGTISATAATTNAATTIMAFMSNKSNQCIGSNEGGNHARNNCFIKGSSNNRNVNAGRNLSPGLGFSPKSVLREIPVVGCNNLSFDKRSSMELEPGRCRRTDGKKWRCSRNVVPDQKYCGRHMHRGAKKQVKNFQPTTIVANSSATSNTAQLPPTTAIPCRTVRAIPSTNLSISIPGSPPQIYNDEKSTSSSSSDTTITDTSINAYAISNVS